MTIYNIVKVGDNMALPKKKSHYTYSDYLEWDESERIELIDGELFMQAAPSRIHQGISAQIMRQLTNYLDGKKCKAYAAPFAVRLFETDSENCNEQDTIVEPDIVVICDNNKLDDRGCKGAPDMVIEILSPSSSKHDRFVKFHLYRRAGVMEYWIVDPFEKSVQVYKLEGGHYNPICFYTSNDIAKVNVLDGCFIELSRVFTE